LGKLTVEKLEIKPEFDMMVYMEISGSNRVEHDLLELFEKYWDQWLPSFRAVKFQPAASKRGFALLYLDKDVEASVEEAWQRSPSEGFALHNLAITMVMTAVRQAVPEVDEGACAPLTVPDRDIKRRFAKMGIEWKEEGAVNRQYAVFTPHPYSGGCEICMMRESCPRSR
jgi:hypothetical protein